MKPELYLKAVIFAVVIVISPIVKSQTIYEPSVLTNEISPYADGITTLDSTVCTITYPILDFPPGYIPPEPGKIKTIWNYDDDGNALEMMKYDYTKNTYLKQTYENTKYENEYRKITTDYESQSIQFTNDNIKKRTIYNYDPKTGNLLSYYLFGYRQNPGQFVFNLKNIYTYDEENRIIRLDIYEKNSENAISEYTTYQYNELGKLKEEILYKYLDTQEQLYSKKVYLYNEKGLLSEIDYYETSDQNADLILESKTVNKYNDKNLRISQQIYEKDCWGEPSGLQLAEKSSFEYDNKGRRIKYQICYLCEFGGIFCCHNYDYEYNESGKLIYSNYWQGDYKQMIIYEIFYSYYDDNLENVMDVKWAVSNKKNERTVYYYNDRDVEFVKHLNLDTRIKIFPSPAEDNITVDLSIIKNICDYTLFSVNGEYITSGTLSNDGNINIKNLKQGLYIIQIHHNGQFISGKFVKR